MDNASQYLKEAKDELERADHINTLEGTNSLLLRSIANSLICIADVLCKGVIETSEVEK